MVASVPHMAPLRRGEEITIHGHHADAWHFTGAYGGSLELAGRTWIDLHEQPGWPPLTFELASIRLIERMEVQAW